MSQEPDLLTRRHFLRTSILGAALSWTVPIFVERTFSLLNAEAAETTTQIATGKDHPILVVLQLAGGNDGRHRRFVAGKGNLHPASRRHARKRRGYHGLPPGPDRRRAHCE